MRAVADGALDVTQEFAGEMSYCLGCLACQTACPAGVNYAELFETARSDIELANAHPGLARRFWRGLTLGFLFMHPRALRLLGRVTARLSAQRTRIVRPPIGDVAAVPLVFAPPGTPDTANRRAILECADRAARTARGSGPIPCRHAHGLCPGSRLSGCESRHG